MSAVADSLLPPATPRRARKRVLPGFGVTMGFTLAYLSLIVLIPLAALVVKSATLSFDQFWATVTAPRVLASYKVTFLISFAAATVNLFAGTLTAWVLVRYRFPGQRVLDALVDLPFALPTAVAGIALTALYAPNGWIGEPLAALGLKVAFTPLGIFVALVFIGLPFIVRTVQPVLQDLDKEYEEAAASLGASRWRTVASVVLPTLAPAIFAGYVLALARAVGEYGSVIFIAGNIPFVSEITPLLIITKLEQYDYAGAAAIGLSMLVISFVMILVINLLQRWQARRSR